jgi:lysophospholipase L1-like esterase
MNPRILLAALLGMGLPTISAAADSPAKAPAKAKPTPDPALAPVEDVAGLPRVLLIGDSVSIGYTLPTRALLQGKANVHRPPTNCSSTGNGLANLKLWLGDKQWDVIHFNFGLHDAKLPPEGVRHAPPDVYEKNLRELVKQMKATGAKLIFATTTTVPNGGNISPTRRFGSVDEYNAIAKRVMTENGVAIDDLHAAITPHLANLQRPNDVHFSAAGSELLAKQVAASIEAALKSKQP